jgi:hypothetical protein
MPTAVGLGARRAVAAVASALALSVVGATGAAASIHTDSFVVVSRDVSVQPFDTGVQYADCPQDMSIVTGGTFWHTGTGEPDLTAGNQITSSTPTDDHLAWYATGVSHESTGTYLRVVAVCLPTASVGAYTLTKDLPIEAGATGSGYLRCRAGKRIISGGAFWRDPTGAIVPNEIAVLGNSSPMTDGTRWYASGRNHTDHPLVLQLVVHCLPNASVGTYTVKTRDFTYQGVGSVRGSPNCPAGKQIVVGGAFWHRGNGVPRANLYSSLYTSAPRPGGRGWMAAGMYDNPGTVKLRVVLLCRPI